MGSLVGQRVANAPTTDTFIRLPSLISPTPLFGLGNTAGECLLPKAPCGRLE